MIDCGEDWRGRYQALHPDAVVLTHAHPDHAAGLDDGAPCPVFATAETWAVLGEAVADRRVVSPRVPTRIRGMTFEAFPVWHSFLAPAVGYRVAAHGVAFFYAPDLVAIRDRRAALADVALYVGDGARITRPLIRRRGRALIGHTSMTAQLAWCAREGVPRAIFTHCGTEILAGDGRRIAALVRALGAAHGMQASVAHDGLRLTIRRVRGPTRSEIHVHHR
jgi:phosphoribosyl 1,2-cyclic phosphodiesterase